MSRDGRGTPGAKKNNAAFGHSTLAIH